LTALDTADDARAAELTERGARIESLPAVAGRLALTTVIERLGELEANEVLVEAGPTLVGALLHASLVDELLVYVAPILLGPTARALVELPQLREITDAPAFSLIDTSQVGEDVRLRLRPRAAAAVG
jgi:diaminohydroxyphosphoribosylaminopyrimidine deaminase/5-amino-6-(5-phosphoribosylamino)uracil reductase